MIPKIVHFIWFGSAQYNARIRSCIDSWHAFLPEYEFKLWNEETFDISNSCKFVKEAYDNKKYAFVSDYVRLQALYEYGGIYLDTDVELVKPFDDYLLQNKAVLALDDGGYISGAIMMSEKQNPFFKEMLKMYDEMTFVKSDGSLNMEVNNTYLQTKLFALGFKLENVYQCLENGFAFYPDDYFHCRSLTTGKLHKTHNTYCIHWHTVTWVSTKTKVINFLRIHVLVPVLGVKLYSKITQKIKGDATTF